MGMGGSPVRMRARAGRGDPAWADEGMDGGRVRGDGARDRDGWVARTDAGANYGLSVFQRRGLSRMYWRIRSSSAWSRIICS